MIFSLWKRAHTHVNFLWKRAFVRDVFTLQIGSAFAYGFGFVKSIVIARLLGLEGFGAYAVALSFTGTLKILTGFGQEQALVTYLAEQYRQKDTQGMLVVFKYFLCMTALAGLILSLLAWSSPFLAGLLYAENAESVGMMARTIFIAFIISLPAPLVIALLQVVRQVRRMTILENLNNVMQLIFAVTLVMQGYGPIGVFLGLLISNVVMFVLYCMQLFSLSKQYELPRLRDAIRCKKSIREYVGQGFFIALDKNIVNFFPQALLFIFSLFAGPSAVGVAQLAIKMSYLPAGLFLGQTVRMANSVLPSMKGAGLPQIRKHVVLLVKHAFVFHTIVVFGGIVLLPFVVIIAYGWEFQNVVIPMIFMLFIRLIQPFNVANISLFRIFRKVHIATYWNAVRVPLELGTFFLLLRYPPAFFVENPYAALVVAVYLHQLGAFSMNFYVYRYLLEIRPLRRRENA
jgi:O-antigen/teichoic acid export membrane protein